MKRFERWFGAVVFAAAAVALLVSSGRDGDWLAGIVFAIVLLAAAWAVSPFFGGRQEPWASIKAKIDDGGVVIFWRPGCVYCLRLKASLGRSGRGAHWVNIWRDPEGAAFVREHNQGNETVPTVLVGGEVLTNPEPGIVSRALAGR
ncbi:glutaredoxin domain-containing protein [Arthrobacter sp. NPDC089319]|uniref:glutaredoxin family protein n=1 Tax=Arthrobacter sp. NPDC089319 TaxID=3155915 RepID=UPI00341D7CB1